MKEKIIDAIDRLMAGKYANEDEREDLMYNAVRYANALAKEDDDYTRVDKVLAPYGVKDENIVFYFDRAGIEDESLVLELQRHFDIVINDIQEANL